MMKWSNYTFCNRELIPEESVGEAEYEMGAEKAWNEKDETAIPATEKMVTDPATGGDNDQL